MGTPRAITGYHAISETLKRSRGEGTLYLSGARRRNRELEEQARSAGVRVSWIGAPEMDERAAGADHRGAVYEGVVESAPRGDLRSELESLGEGPRLVVVLDHLKDPHNLGAILRSADQFGADLVLLPDRRSVQVTPAVARVSAGASANVRTVVVPNLAGAMGQLRDAGFWVYGAALSGSPLEKVAFAPRTALVMGSEGKGLATLTTRDCDELVSIPRARGAQVDSLNVSVAAGILLYAIRRSQGMFEAP